MLFIAKAHYTDLHKASQARKHTNALPSYGKEKIESQEALPLFSFQAYETGEESLLEFLVIRTEILRVALLPSRDDKLISIVGSFCLAGWTYCHSEPA